MMSDKLECPKLCSVPKMAPTTNVLEVKIGTRPGPLPTRYVSQITIILTEVMQSLRFGGGAALDFPNIRFMVPEKRNVYREK